MTSGIILETDPPLAMLVATRRIGVHSPLIVALHAGRRELGHEALSRGPADSLYTQPLAMYEVGWPQGATAFC